MVGLGKMGLNMSKRLISRNINVTAFDISTKAVELIAKEGAEPALSIKELVLKLNEKRKIVWLMLPSGKITENAFQELKSLLSEGDVIIEGGNSNFLDTLRRHDECEAKSIGMLDVGVSGGILAKDTGYPMMIGGNEDIYKYCEPIFKSLGKKKSYGLVGSIGSGHYVKMIHNAIEYGMMQAISEGFDLLENGRFNNLDVKNITQIWNNGSIVNSLLMEMAGKVLDNNAQLEGVAPYVNDSGEGKWAAIEAMEQSVPFVANTYALHARYISRDANSYAFRMLAAIRSEFGGHETKGEND